MPKRLVPPAILSPVLFALVAGGLFGQAPSPAFEVASIKPAPPISALAAQIQSGKLHVGMSIDGARVDIGFMSLAELIPTAYRVKPYQVSGPDWMRQERFDILATLPEGASKDQVPEMLQALLTERFKLASHRENKEHPVYALVVGKNGVKMKEAAPDADAPAADAPAAIGTPPPPGGGRGGFTLGTANGPVTVVQQGRGMSVSGGPGGPTRIAMGENGTMRMEMSKMSMGALADMLAPFVDRPVVDMTDLKGNYQVTLELSMQEMMAVAQNAARTAGIALPGPGAGPGFGGGGPLGPGAAGAGVAPAASDPSGSSMFTAVQQLGLKLEPRKAAVETIVIDHLEKTPTEN